MICVSKSPPFKFQTNRCRDMRKICQLSRFENKHIDWLLSDTMSNLTVCPDPKSVTTRGRSKYVESWKRPDHQCADDLVDLKDSHIPWREIFTSAPVWAIITAHACNNWANYTLLMCTPMYMKEVLRFDIKQVRVRIRKSFLPLDEAI